MLLLQPIRPLILPDHLLATPSAIATTAASPGVLVVSRDEERRRRRLLLFQYGGSDCPGERTQDGMTLFNYDRRLERFARKIF